MLNSIKLSTFWHYRQGSGLTKERSRKLLYSGQFSVSHFIIDVKLKYYTVLQMCFYDFKLLFGFFYLLVCMTTLLVKLVPKWTETDVRIFHYLFFTLYLDLETIFTHIRCVDSWKRFLTCTKSFCIFLRLRPFWLRRNFIKIVRLVRCTNNFPAETQGADWLNSVPSKIAEFSVRSAKP